MDESGNRVGYRGLFLRGELKEPTLAVVRCAGSFQRLWDSAHSGFGDSGHPGQPSIPPVPEIDWTREIVIAAALGMRPTITGYAVYLSLSEDEYGLRVLVHERHPEPDRVHLTAIGYPTILAAVATSAVEVAFHLQDPVVGYQPTAEQQSVRQAAFDLWQRTQQEP